MMPRRIAGPLGGPIGGPAGERESRIGIAGPIEFAALAGLLDEASNRRWRERGVRGLGGTPVVLLILELHRRGRTIVVMTLDPALSSDEELVLIGPRITIHASGVRRVRPRTLDLFAKERRFIATVARRERPTLIHAHWTYEYSLGAVASGLPTVATAHDAPWWVLRYDHHPYRIMRTLMALWSARRIAVLTTVSPYVARHWRRYLGYRGRIATIPNGMPGHLFSFQHGRQIEPGATVFATILQGWMGRKNGQNAILAFAQVRQRHPQFRLLMFGDGHDEGGLAHQWAIARGISDGIEFRGKLPYNELMAEVKQRVDVLVHPSLEEAHPMAVIECMALGIPVIGGKAAGGVPFTLGFGAAGLLVDVRSAEAIAQAMTDVGSQPSRLRAIGEQGRRFAHRRFSIERVVDQYERIYARTLALAGVR